MRSLWEEDQVWQDRTEVPWLQGGLAPRVSRALPAAMHPQPGRDTSQNWGGMISEVLVQTWASSTYHRANSWPQFILFSQGVLSDYVHDSSPMIPPLVVHCVNEIEQRGLLQVRQPYVSCVWISAANVRFFFPFLNVRKVGYCWRIILTIRI